MIHQSYFNVRLVADISHYSYKGDGQDIGIHAFQIAKIILVGFGLEFGASGMFQLAVIQSSLKQGHTLPLTRMRE